MKSVSKQIAELDAFFDNFRGNRVSNDGEARKSFENCYKEFHCILIWQNFIDNSNTIDDQEKIFFNEMTSDIAHSIVSSILDLYKPSKMALRSAIENSWRTLMLMENQKIDDIKTVYDLYLKLKELNSEVNIVLQPINELKQMYTYLCDYVHSSTPMHMDFRIKFKTISTRNQNEQSTCFKIIQKTCSNINKSLFVKKQHAVVKMHHSQADWLRDRLPATFKRQAARL